MKIINKKLRENLFKLDIAFFAFVSLIAFTFVSLNLKIAVKESQKNQAAIASIPITDASFENKETVDKKDTVRLFAIPDLEAKAFAVYDLSNNKLIAGNNSGVPLPLASLTKIFTAILTAKYLDGDTVTITQKDLETEGYSGLKEGSEWDTKTLAAYMLVVSSNDAAEALRRKLEDKTGKSYSRLVKDLSSSLGLKQSFALNASGLDEGYDLGGAYSSAEEIARLLNYATNFAPKIFSPTEKSELVFHDLDGNSYIAKNTNARVEYIFNILASKTGYTDLAGGNLAVLFEIEPEHPIAIVVLGSSKEGRFDDVKKLYEATLDYLN